MKTPTTPTAPNPAPTAAPTNPAPAPSNPQPATAATPAADAPKIDLPPIGAGLEDFAEWPKGSEEAKADKKPAAEKASDVPPSEPEEGTPETKGEVPKPDEPEAKPEGLSDDLAGLISKKKPDEAKTSDKPIGAPKELREAYENQGRRLKEMEAELSKVRETHEQELAKSKAELEKLTTELRYLNFQATPEFEREYMAPIVEAQQQAEEAITGVKFQLEDGQTRDASIQDVLALAQLPPGTAWDKTSELFGNRASLVYQSVKSIRDGYLRMQKAQKEWREKGAEWKKAQEIQRENAMREIRKAEDDRMSELSQIAPDYFGGLDSDNEAKSLVDKSQAVVDLALGRATMPEGTDAQTHVKAVARARGELAARSRFFPVLVLKLQRAQKQIDDLNAKLRGFEKSEPGTTPPAGEAKRAEAPTGIEGLAAIAVDSR